MTQKKLISELLKKHKGYIVGSLGTISKDLPDEKRIVKVKGAMGCAIAVGLGLALSVKNEVLVIIGDGSYLMKAGSIATVNRYNLKNLKIIVIQNNKYESCGGENNFKYLWKYSPALKIEKISASS